MACTSDKIARMRARVEWLRIEGHAAKSDRSTCATLALCGTCEFFVFVLLALPLRTCAL
jgi:hypothetical protein